MTTDITLRPGTLDDAEICGRICYSAFRTIAAEHNFPTDFPTPEAATETLAHLLAHPGFYSVVAEAEGRIVGSNFLDECGRVCGVGPASVDPAVQNRGVGRRLMLDVLRRGANLERRAYGCCKSPTTTAHWPCTPRSGSKYATCLAAYRVRHRESQSPAIGSVGPRATIWTPVIPCAAMCLGTTAVQSWRTVSRWARRWSSNTTGE
ncbi:GNAT family N-acetyltransferase [Mycobacterium sp. SM1]|nr:GNAT family N-acetyltransferase [Mycobacterium sp. SM1]